MAGYKIVLRVLLVLLLVGGVGFLLYYFAFGGSSKATDAYMAYKNFETSKEKALFDEKTNNESFMNNLKMYNNESLRFEGYYECYMTQELVFSEVGDALYFSPKKAENKKTLEKRISSYYGALKNCAGKLEIFDKALIDYSSENSDAGTTFSSWEEGQLRGLLPVVNEAMKNLAIKAYEVNCYSLDYARNSCLGGNTYGSLKYTMLDAIKEQSNALREAFDDESVDITSFSKLTTYNQTARKSYLYQKENNFVDGVDVSSACYSFRNNYYTLTNEEKSEFFKAVDKASLVSKKTGSLKDSLTQICDVMGWLV
ncbi:MAG: hypothetical protein IJ837_04620 [Clostridia bacterium]|nr:hypothetical protein [Clostridia bacterium]